MNQEHRKLREGFRSMSRDRAIDRIQSFHLLPEEELAIIEIDVNNVGYTKFCEDNHASPEVVKKIRNRAYAKMVDAIAYQKEKASG